jgi:hypothetical protein
MLAVILALAYVNSRQLRTLSVAAWLSIVLIFWRSNYALISNEPIVDFVALCAASAIILLVLSQFHTRMHQALAKVQEANAALHGQRANLETQVAERTASLQQAMDDLEVRAAEQQRLLAETEQQRDAIRADGEEHLLARLGRALEPFHLAWLEDLIPWQHTDLWKRLTESIPLPTCTVPPTAMVVPPVKVLVPVRMSVLGADCTSAPAPEITPE